MWYVLYHTHSSIIYVVPSTTDTTAKTKSQTRSDQDFAEVSGGIKNPKK